MAGLNAYATLEQANQYHSIRLTFAQWNALSDDVKMARLVAGSDYIDAMYRFRGVKTDPNQARQFPRNGATDIPLVVMYACCELGCVSGSLNAQQSAMRSSVTVGEISVSYDTSQSTKQYGSRGLYPFVDGYLADWLLSSDLGKRFGAIVVGG